MKDTINFGGVGGGFGRLLFLSYGCCCCFVCCFVGLLFRGEISKSAFFHDTENRKSENKKKIVFLRTFHPISITSNSKKINQIWFNRNVKRGMFD